MKSGQIKALRYEKTIDRRKKIVAEAWVRQPTRDYGAKPNWFGTTATPSKPTVAPVLLAMTAKAVPDDLKSILKNHLEAGGRAYLLTPPNFDAAAELRSLTDLEKAQVLIRQLPRTPQSGYYHSEAGIWYSPLGDRAARHHLRLTVEQADEWRHLFLRSFWHEAEKEQHFAKGKWTPLEACWHRPADISRCELTCWQASPDDLEARKRVPPVEIAHCLQATKPGSASLHTKPDFNAADLLQIAATKGVQIFGLSPHLPECYLQGSEGWLLCGDKDAIVLKLSREQVQEARELLGLSQNQRYVRERDLTSLQQDFPGAEFLLPEAKDWERIAGVWPADKAKDLGRITARNLPDLMRTELRWEEDDQRLRAPALALAAHFTWEVVPPVAPAKNEDALYEDWKQHTLACETLRVKLAKRTKDLVELNSGWDEEFPNAFEDYSALKISLGKLADYEQSQLSKDETPKLRQALMDHLQAWQEEANHARSLLNHALQVQDWLFARKKHAERIKGIQATLLQKPLPKLDADASEEAKADFADRQKELTKLEDELARLQKDLADKYRVPPADKSDHAELKAHRPLEKFTLKSSPTETLPAVGKLYFGKGVGGQPARFLAIADWAEHEAAQKEADRLRAFLVAEAS